MIPVKSDKRANSKELRVKARAKTRWGLKTRGF